MVHGARAEAGKAAGIRSKRNDKPFVAAAAKIGRRIRSRKGPGVESVPVAGLRVSIRMSRQILDTHMHNNGFEYM